MKESTIFKLVEEMQDIKASGLSIPAYLVSKGKSETNLYSRISQFKADPENIENHPEVLALYEELKGGKKASTGMRWWTDRDENDIIIKYHIVYPIRDREPFLATLNREEVEAIYSLYTYYGGNITARQVASEFPRYTLSELKMIIRTFGITKDSSWLCPHLLEELSPDQAAQYRMAVKEKAAFKYCDARQERDFSNQIKKMASEINQLKDRKELAQSLLGKIDYEKIITKPITEVNTTTGIVCLSDLHIGAFNVPEGYIDLEEYNETEINRRLDYILYSIQEKKWNKVIILNLGDNVDSYRKMTTSMSHVLPCVLTDKQIAQMYLRVMMRFMNGVKSIFKDTHYYSIGSGNHSGSWGWLLDVTLSQQLQTLEIKTYVSNNEIDSFDVNGTSFLYLHGKSTHEKGQFKGFPLNLNDKTQCWFNDFFADTDLVLQKRKVVLKGDLHQYSINSVSSFDYINCPSVYASSTYIVSNFGKTPWGCAYLEIDRKGNYTSGIIRE